MVVCISIVDADLFFPYLVDRAFFREQFGEVEDRLFLSGIAEDVDTGTSVIDFKVGNRLQLRVLESLIIINELALRSISFERIAMGKEEPGFILCEEKVETFDIALYG